MTTTQDTVELKRERDMLVSVVKEPYCWPGGYDKVLVLCDGALLCNKCAKREATRIMSDIREGYDTGWMPAAVSYEAVSAEYAAEVDPDLVSYCGHCNAPIGELGC